MDKYGRWTWCRTWIATLIMLALPAGMIGCGTLHAYAGEKLPNSETALLTVKSDSIVIPLLIYNSIQTMKVRSVDDFPTRGRLKVRVIPGWHQLHLETSMSGFTVGGGGTVNDAYDEIAFRADAGHEYLLRADYRLFNGRGLSNRAWYVWIENAATGDVVGGSPDVPVRKVETPTSP